MGDHAKKQSEASAGVERFPIEVISSQGHGGSPGFVECADSSALLAG
jgi:hypothetical protein